MADLLWGTVRAWLVTTLLLFPAYSSAQDTVPAPQEGVAAGDDAGVFKAPVIIEGSELFQLRGSSALPANERVENVRQNIIHAAEASDRNAVTITFSRSDIGIDILVDGARITTVTEADANLDQMDLQVLARLQAEAIERAILTYRSGRTDEALVNSTIAALVWTLAFAGFSLLIFWLRRVLKRRLTGLVHRYFASLESATNAQVQAEAIAALIRFGVNILLFSLFFLGIYYYLSFVLLAFAETRPIAQLLLTYVTEPVLNILLGFVGYLPNLITLVIIAFLTRYMIKGLRVFFDAVEAGSFELRNFERHWIEPSYNIGRVVIVLIALVFSFPYIPGSDSAAFQGLTLLVGAMLSLGSNSVVSNVLSGLFVIYRRSTSIGDRIKVGDHVGDVVEIKLMETHLKSIKNELVSIPNAQLLNSDVVNFSKKVDGSGLLLHTQVGIGYEEPPEKVEAMLIEAANRTKGLKTKPEPFVLWAELADYAITYQINAYTTRGAWIPKMKSDLHRNIVAVFNENRVQIMTPSYEADPPEPKIPSETWDGKLAHQTGSSG